MKKFLGLTWEQAIAEAKAQGREVELHYEADEDGFDWIEVSTAEGNGAALYFEDGVCSEYVFLDWA